MQRLDWGTQLIWKWSMPWRGLVFVFMFIYTVPVWAGVTYMIALGKQPPCAFEVKRGNEPIKVLMIYATPLQTNDTIKVLPTQQVGGKPCSITLVDNGVVEEITADRTRETPYLVKGSAATPTPMDGPVQKIRNGEIYVKMLEEGTAKSSNSTPAKLTMSMFKPNVTAKLVAANRKELYLGWHGGEAPYKVTVKVSQKNKPSILLEVDKLDKPEVKLACSELEVGQTYEITLVDKNGKDATGTAEVVDLNGSILTQKEVQQLQDNNDPAKQALLAAWLVQHVKDGTWNLEAYQRVAKETDYPPALWIKQGLKDGVQLP
ncbi:MAG: hypothetical protein BWK78_04110 [Thiotrichaceae bacterium IS1]|nr:MAG: hypothetical protein BWK78_04110 [Thiotrichaceae bacterium IS1]